MNKLQVHDKFKTLLLALLPYERAALEESILSEGCRDPLIVWGNYIVDGHNRYEICSKHGVEYKTVSMEFADEEAAMDWIDRNQLGRRNLSPDAFKLTLGRIYNRTKKTKAEAGAKGGSSSGQNVRCLRTAEKLAKEHAVDEKTVRRAGKFAKEVETNPELQEAIANNVSVKEFKKKKNRKYPDKTFDGYCDDIEITKMTGMRWIHKYFPEYLPIVTNVTIPPPPPEGKCDLIVIDPPWPYGTEYNAETRRVASPYPELDISELEKIDIPSADNCVLWCWATHKFIWDAKNLLEKWGFEYKLTLVWDKQKMGIGAWLRCQVEFCLLGIKGKPAWNLTNERDIISVPRREHSRKPDEFYKMAEKVSGGQKKLDMFSREGKENWQGWGNETGKF